MLHTFAMMQRDKSGPTSCSSFCLSRCHLKMPFHHHHQNAEPKMCTKFESFVPFSCKRRRLRRIVWTRKCATFDGTLQCARSTPMARFQWFGSNYLKSIRLNKPQIIWVKCGRRSIKLMKKMMFNSLSGSSELKRMRRSPWKGRRRFFIAATNWPTDKIRSIFFSTV